MHTPEKEPDQDGNAVLTADELGQLRSSLAAMPDSVPPRVVWERIEAQARAEGLLASPVLSARTRWLTGAAIAAAVVLAVLNVPAPTPNVPTQGGVPPQTIAGTEPLRTEPEFLESAAEGRLRTINALMVRSQFLERDLRRLPSSPQLMRAGTAATIDELQDRIAAIDYRLSQAGSGMTGQERELFWRERVRLMDSLLKLRLAQSQRGSF